jgi:hypothetical protein
MSLLEGAEAERYLLAYLTSNKIATSTCELIAGDYIIGDAERATLPAMLRP